MAHTFLKTPAGDFLLTPGGDYLITSREISTSRTLARTPVVMSLSGTQATDVGAGVKTMTFPTMTAGIYENLLDNGTGNDQANALASLTGTVSAGTPVLVDLAFPDDVTGPVLQIKTLLIKETTTSGTNHLLVGDTTGTLTNACTIFWPKTTGSSIIGSGGAIALHNPLGYAIVGSNNQLKLSADTGTCTYQIDLIGVQ